MNWLSWAGRAVTGRRAERQTITFTEPVRRVEVKLPAGAVSFAPAGGPARVHRTIRRAITRAGQVHGTDLESADVRVESDAGGLSLAFAAPPAHVEARTKAGSVELSVPGGPYAVDATSSAGRVQVDVADGPSVPRQLIAHSGAGRVRIRRH